MKDLGKWGNSISSMVILSGTWKFFDDEDFKGTKMATLGPGIYPTPPVTSPTLCNGSCHHRLYLRMMPGDATVLALVG
jgi:Beta/Gamma crystallin